MTAPPAILPGALGAFPVSIAAVNEWRGRCLANFATIEAAVIETLALMGRTGAKPGTTHLYGQRLTALESILADRAGCVEVREALGAVRLHDRLRTFLAHGEAGITLDQNRHWQAIVTLRTLRGAAVERTFLIVEEGEALGVVHALAHDRSRLVARLTACCESISKSVVPASARIRILGAI